MADLILPEPPEQDGFNPKAKIPFGVTTTHVYAAMQDFVEFMKLIDTQLHRKEMASLENTMMQANFSSLVGEMMAARIPKHCPAIVKNDITTATLTCCRLADIRTTLHSTPAVMESKLKRHDTSRVGKDTTPRMCGLWCSCFKVEGRDQKRKKRPHSSFFLSLERCYPNRIGNSPVDRKPAVARLPLASSLRERQR
jgi:hypothetical protein